VIELTHLTLKHLALCRYKSIKRVDFDNLNNVVLLMGRNNAGKSNILDAFKFLSEAAASFDHALAARGHDVVQLIHRKRPEDAMEFLFDFVIAPRKREEIIRRLFTGNAQAELTDALNSELLSALTLKITVGPEHFVEELSTPHSGGSRPFVIFSIKGAPGNMEVLCGQLETLCKQRKGDPAPGPVPLAVKPETAQPYRLWLGRPESAAEAWPVSYELADAVYQQFTCLEWADPMRKLPATSPILGGQKLTPDISNLPDVLHWLYNNKPKQFRKIESEENSTPPRCRAKPPLV